MPGLLREGGKHTGELTEDFLKAAKLSEDKFHAVGRSLREVMDKNVELLYGLAEKVAAKK